MFAQARAAIVAASNTAAPPVSVRRKLRSGVCALRAQAVRPENGEGPATWLTDIDLQATPRTLAERGDVPESRASR